MEKLLASEKYALRRDFTVGLQISFEEVDMPLATVRITTLLLCYSFLFFFLFCLCVFESVSIPGNCGFLGRISKVVCHCFILGLRGYDWPKVILLTLYLRLD